jgi:hypothetical protein
MICNICGKDQVGCCVEIVTGTLIDTNTTRYSSSTTTKKTYSNFQPMEFWICQECWRSRRRKNDDTAFTVTGLLFALSVGFVILGIIFPDSNMELVGFILGLISLIALIDSFYKRSKTPYSQIIMQHEQPITIFRLFKNDIADLVYKTRGKTYYWDRKSWQQWMAEGGNPKEGTFVSRS